MANRLNILRATRSFTNAEIIALKTTAITVLSAPGAGFRYVLSHAVLNSSFTGAVYTGIDAAAYLVLATNTLEFSSYLFNSAAAPVSTDFTDFFGSTTKKSFTFREWTNAYGAAEGSWGNAAHCFPTNFANDTIRVVMVNGASNLGGGNAANTMSIMIYYTIEAV